MTDLGFWLLLITSLLAGGPGEEWRVAYTDGTVEAFQRPPILAEARRQQVDSVWAWSPEAAPRRIDPEAIGRELPAPDKVRLRVQVPGAQALKDARVMAGPVELWTDVPEDLLPVWPLPRTGEISIPLDPGRSWRLRLASSSRGTWWVDLPAGQTSVRLDPNPARAVDLLVTGRDGKPLDGAWMRLLEGAQGRRGRAKPWSLHLGTQGRISAPALPDAEEIVAFVGAPGYLPAVLRGRLADLPDQVKLGPGAAVGGRFTDDRGRPLQGVRVGLEAWISPDVADLIRRSAETTATGAWSVAVLPAGEAALVAQARGFAPYRARVELAEGKTDLGSIRLQRGKELRIVVVDDLGAPLAGAAAAGGPGLSGRTDPKGEAVLLVDPGEPVDLEVSAPHHVLWKSRVEPGTAPPLRVTLERAVNILGRLVDSHGRPVEEGMAALRRGSLSRTLALEPGGAFDIDLPAGVEADLTLSSPTTRELRVPLPAGDPGERRDLGALRAPAGIEISGRVTSAKDGAPVAGARIWLPRPGGDGQLLAWVDRDLLEARSGPDGRFRMTGAPEGPLLLRIDAVDFARAHLAVQAEPGATALDAGEVALHHGADLRVAVSGSPPEGALAHADLRGDWLEMDTLTAPVRDGAALLRNIPPGKVRITVRSGRTLLCELETAVLEDEEAQVECSGGALRVAGVVRIGERPAGAGSLLWIPPAPGLPGRINNLVSEGGLRQQQVFGEGRPQVEVPVAEDGSFVTEDLSSGSWQVFWVPASGSLSRPRQVDIPALPEPAEWATVLTFPGGTLAGIVVDSRNRPVPEARVRDLDSGAVALSSPDGAFALTGAEAGSHSLQAERDELASAVVEAEVPADGSGDPVRLVLDERESPEIRMKTLDADQAPVSGAFVFLEEEGKGQRLLTTGAGGLAVARLDSPIPARVRLAALVNGAWSLGSWLSWQELPDTVILSSAPSGSLRIESPEATGSPRILSPGGWDVAWLSTRLGARPVLGPGAPLEVQGLPEGVYTVILEEKASTVSIRAGEQSTLALGRFP